MANKNKTKTAAPAKKSSMPSIFSPEGALIVLVAVILDVTGMIIGGVALIVALFSGGVGELIDAFSLVPDVVGLATIGLWSWFRMEGSGFKGKLWKFAKRPGLVTVGEVLPTGILPLWTIYVFMKLRK